MVCGAASLTWASQASGEVMDAHEAAASSAASESWLGMSLRPRRASQCDSSHRADAAVMSSQSADQSRDRMGDDAARRVRSVAYLWRQGECLCEEGVWCK
jgi:hypothetical protein